jgi:hypothetical protein
MSTASDEEKKELEVDIQGLLVRKSLCANILGMDI